MANLPATLDDRNQLPTHLRRPSDRADKFIAPDADSFGRISFLGKTFTPIYGDRREPFLDERGRPQQELDVVMIDANHAVSRAFWGVGSGFDKDATDPPLCAAIMGIRPDPSVPEPQNDKCVSCPMNKFGSANDGTNAKACKSNRRVAVVPAGDLENADWGGPMLIGIPRGAFKDLNRHARSLKRDGADPSMCVTRLTFDYNEAVPRPQFEFVRWVDEDEDTIIKRWQEEDIVKRICYFTADPNEEASTDEGPEEGTPIAEVIERAKLDLARTAALEAEGRKPTVVAGPAAEKIAAARAAARTGPPPTAPKTNGEAKGFGKPKTVATVAPTAEKVVAVTKPVKAEAKQEAKPVKETVEEKKERLRKLIEEAEALHNEVGDDDDEEGGEVEAAAEEEVTPGPDEISAKDLIGDLDDELGAIPD